MIEIRPAREPVVGQVRLPGSKSYTNRVLLLAALADGVTTIESALFSDDTRYMAESLRRLGLTVTADETMETLQVTGAGGRIPAVAADLYCGNAGTATRFLTAFCALGHGRYRIDGNERMRQRPQQPLLDALQSLGVEATSQRRDGCPPLTIVADGCRGGRVRMAGDLSSQYFSALAMVGAALPDGLEIEVEGELVSQPYLDLTADAMASFGVALENDHYRRFRVAPGQRYLACDYRVEPDASSASYFFAAAAVTGGRVTVLGLHRASRQGDVRFVEVLAEMGCEVTDNAYGLTVAGPSRLRGVTVDMNAISDTALTLAVIAPFADGPTEIRNIAHARGQESDRIAAVATELGRLGVAVTEHPDGWRIEPGEPHGGEVETYDDHRLAMSFAILGLKTAGLWIRDPDCVKKTVPEFFTILRGLTATGLV